MEDFPHYTYHDLLKMKIGDRKALALRLLENGRAKPTVRLDREWGRFEDLPELDDERIGEEVGKLLSRMTLEQKVNQMTPNTSAEEYIPACLKYNDFPYVAGEDYGLEIPGIHFSDGPTGVVMGRSSSCFPVSMGRGASWDIDLEERIGEAMGMEARSQGANFFGGVCINLLRHPSWGRSQETYGEDPHLLGRMGSSMVRGLQKHLMACVKHYALNSLENSRYKLNVEIDERSLREVYLPHFKACIDEGVASVMTAYNKVRTEYCAENVYLLTDVLWKEWGFRGFAISDFIHGIRDAAKAVKAGLDIEMPIEGHYGRNLVSLVKSGKVEESLIDLSARRIMETKLRFSKRGDPSAYGAEKLACKEHRELALESALCSAVLLRNRDGLLPLSRTGTRKVALLGALAKRANIGEMKGSSHVYPPYVITPYDGLREYLSAGTTLSFHERIDGPSAARDVREADAVILVVGLTSDDEGEFIPHWNSGCGGDRTDLGLKAEDVDLIEAAAGLNANTVVVLQGGGAIMTSPWDSRAGALLMTWYPGMEGGKALARLLFGDFNPCGKLPLTIPSSAGQLVHFDKDADEIAYGYFHGYFLADEKGFEVAYPFGFGLSYTTYEYSDFTIDRKSVREDGTLEVSVTVRNAGTRDGDEIVQLYSAYENPPVTRHAKDLRAFRKVHLKAGERKRVEFSLPVSELARYDEVGKAWTVDKAGYRLLAGSSSRRRDLLEASFEVI